MDQSLVTVRGRKLFIPTIEFRKKHQQPVRLRSQWDLANVNFFDGKPLDKWLCLNIYMGNQPGDLRPSLKAFVKELDRCGVKCQEPAIKHIPLNTINTAPDAISALADEFKTLAGPEQNHRFLLIILPRDSPDLYNHIKRLGDREHGILTCCVLGNNKKFFNRKNPATAVQYDANVALKVNLKLGGTNYVLGHGQLYNIWELENKTMVVGIDVTHPSVGSSDNAPSVAAMVTSDKQLVQWPAELRINKSREEMVGKLRPMLESRLRWWREKYNDLPENLLIYRDGVSEGQYQAVLDEELPQIRDACRTIYQDAYAEVTHPKISLVVVGKRHHTRFMRKTKKGLIDDSDNGKASNPEPGTVSQRKHLRPLRTPNYSRAFDQRREADLHLGR